MAARGHPEDIGQLPEPSTATAQSMHEGCQSRSRYTEPTYLCFFQHRRSCGVVVSSASVPVYGLWLRLATPQWLVNLDTVVVSKVEAIMKPRYLITCLDTLPALR